jgi:heparosan-N-sulfate-glucuronate 5-epimerase
MRVGQKAAGAALSRGVGYEPQPPGRHFRDTAVHGYPMDFTPKTRSSGVVSPADLAQLALGWWERMLDGEVGARADFEQVVEQLSAQAVTVNGELRWPTCVPLPKYGIAAPWYSAMSQGQVASVFVRAYLLSRRDRFRSLAEDAIEPLLVQSDNDFVSFTDHGPILEEGPPSPRSSARSHILNGWIYALWGVWDVSLAFDHRTARDAFDDGVKCLRATLEQYDVGWWTRYDLTQRRIAHLAKPFYHRIHVGQTEMMYRLTGFSDFRDASRRWAAYDEPKRRVAAISHKALYELDLARRSDREQQ